MRIDHVIVGTSDLEAGIANFEQLTGVKPVLGGEHPGQGTRNALLSLGSGTYLELYAPNPNEPMETAAVTELRNLPGLRPLGWAVNVPDVAGVRSALATRGLVLSVPEAGSRKRPDGSVIQWETFGYAKFEHPLAPFFIHWKQADLHPSRTSPDGCRLDSIKLFDPEPEALTTAIGPLRLNVGVEKASGRRMELELTCPKGKVTLR